MPYQGAAFLFLVGVGIATAALMYFWREHERFEQPHGGSSSSGHDDGNDYPRNSWTRSTEVVPVSRRRRRQNQNAGSYQICSICQEEMSEGPQLRELSCGHNFHCRCIDKWAEVRRECPYCRRAF